MRKFFKEFKEFITKGNVFDMAVGLIVATAFNKIVTSMVNDIIMPLVTWATGANSVADLSIVLKTSVDANGKIVELTWKYGNFLQTVIDFLIIAFSVFVMVKVVNTSRKHLQNINETVKKQTKKEFVAEKREVKKLAKEQNRPFKEVWAEHLEEKTKLAEEEKVKQEKAEKEKAEQERLNNPTTEELLKQILVTLQQEKITKE